MYYNGLSVSFVWLEVEWKYRYQWKSYLIRYLTLGSDRIRLEKSKITVTRGKGYETYLVTHEPVAADY